MAFSYGFGRDEEQNKRGDMQSYFGGQQKPDTRMAQPKTQNVNPAQFRQQPATYGAATQKAPSYGAPAYSGATQKAPSYQAPAYGGTSKTSSAPAYSTAPTAAGTSTSSRATAAPASTMQAYFDQSAAPAYGDIGAGYGKGKSAIEQALGGMFDSTGQQVGTTGQSGFYGGGGFGVPQDQGTSYSASGAVAPTNVKPTTLESPADPNAPPSTTPFIQATPGLGSETADKFANTAGGLQEYVEGKAGQYKLSPEQKQLADKSGMLDQFVEEKLGRYKQTPASQQESGATGGAEGGVFGDKAGSVLSEENEAKYPGDTSHQEQSKAIGQALLDAIYGKAQYGVDPEVLNANMVALQREADKAKIAQNQMLGARGFGASGVAAADLGSIQSAANAKKADIAYQNAIDAAKQRNEMILGLGNMSLQDYQLSQALENQKAADQWTAVNNILSMLGGEKMSPEALAGIVGAALGGEEGAKWGKIGKGIVVNPKTGNVTNYNPQGDAGGEAPKKYGGVPTPQTPPKGPSASGDELKTVSQQLSSLGLPAGTSDITYGDVYQNSDGYWQMNANVPYNDTESGNKMNAEVEFEWNNETGQWTVIGRNDTPVTQKVIGYTPNGQPIYG